MNKIILVIIVNFFTFNAIATETCSRVATINYQEILVDSNSNAKGEGLRFHLEKDPVAKDYLDLYQKNTGLHWQNALMGSLGTGVLIVGFFQRNSSDRNTWLISGASIILVNILVSKTLEISNEANLIKAIDEYNKRNLPKIFFSPEENRSQIENFQYKVGFLESWSF